MVTAFINLKRLLLISKLFHVFCTIHFQDTGINYLNRCVIKLHAEERELILIYFRANQKKLSSTIDKEKEFCFTGHEIQYKLLKHKINIGNWII